MNSEFGTIVSVDYGFEVNPTRPVTTYTEVIDHGKCAEFHAHPRAQIISCDRGIMEVVTEKNIWIVNPAQNVWIASGEGHQVFFPNNVKVVSAFIDGSKLNGLPEISFAFDTSTFLKSLLAKLISFGNPIQLTSQQHRIVEVFLDELYGLEPSKTYLPTSSDIRIKKVADALMLDISGKHSIEYYAGECCVSSRTLSRVFRKEMGMSFGEWRSRLKFLEAVKQLGENRAVKDIAFNLGYENVSSFIVAFKKHFGKTPASYLGK